MKYILSGGGTGGHIFPAIAIADAIKQIDPAADILFVGAEGKMEMERVPKAGYPIEGLWISGLQRRLSLDLLAFPFKLLSSWWRSRRILARFQPDAVVGVGGYASGVIVRTAAGKGIPTLIHEQNSFAGLTNRTLGKSVNKVCVASEGMERFFPKDKIIFTGNPVRADIFDRTDRRAEAAAHYGFSPDKPTLFIVGGSLGARTLNDTMRLHLDQLRDAGVQVLWQCGKIYYEEFAPIAANYTNVRLLAFIDKMPLAYQLADVVVSRAGALSIAELCAVARPAIFVPSPNVTDDHQTANARRLTDHAAALLVSDSDARQQLIPQALQLLSDPNKRAELQANIAPLATPNAAIDIAREVIALAQQRKK